MGCIIARHRIPCCTLSVNYLNNLLFKPTSRSAVTRAERDGTSNVQAKSSIGGECPGSKEIFHLLSASWAVAEPGACSAPNLVDRQRLHLGRFLASPYLEGRFPSMRKKYSLGTPHTPSPLSVIPPVGRQSDWEHCQNFPRPSNNFACRRGRRQDLLPFFHTWYHYNFDTGRKDIVTARHT